MAIRVGVIGTGVMGADHARLFDRGIRGAILGSVADPDKERAKAVAGDVSVFSDPLMLIRSSQVDAVVIASPDHTHRDIVMACLEAKKPVLCEKPLAIDAAQCLEIVRTEEKLGQKLVQVGFMRRFDPCYAELKSTLQSGSIGTPRIVHNQHRNAQAPEWFTAHMAVTNSFVHEIDVTRWLLGAEFVRGYVTEAPRTGDAPKGDPLMIMLETDTGAIVSTEVFMNAAYGYHVHCEIAGTSGTASMAHPALTRTRLDRAERGEFPENWIPRFADAYRIQDQVWINSLLDGTHANEGATAWDGFVATSIAEQLVNAIETGTPVDLVLPERP
ncbi:Gfo/Idh/MocA family oxidoreductase [Rhizobiales bacterium]|uniref:Gfo/Idh/MocA family protein n=1 Tax=Hongsoonwoonella zoysiae TaxID=2821844 RepID=UPI00155FD7D2|nr:Gfo/Idh/MocA family oxidoreductase [Hongsoonwoonella zoysiae]NRG18259.1 Gfo/Idh/MocA family oxidoreductase [Hongsoonwoonella zoysiae]